MNRIQRDVLQACLVTLSPQGVDRIRNNLTLKEQELLRGGYFFDLPMREIDAGRFHSLLLHLSGKPQRFSLIERIKRIFHINNPAAMKQFYHDIESGKVLPIGEMTKFMMSRNGDPKEAKVEKERLIELYKEMKNNPDASEEEKSAVFQKIIFFSHLEDFPPAKNLMVELNFDLEDSIEIEENEVENFFDVRAYELELKDLKEKESSEDLQKQLQDAISELRGYKDSYAENVRSKYIEFLLEMRAKDAIVPERSLFSERVSMRSGEWGSFVNRVSTREESVVYADEPFERESNEEGEIEGDPFADFSMDMISDGEEERLIDIPLPKNQGPPDEDQSSIRNSAFGLNPNEFVELNLDDPPQSQFNHILQCVKSAVMNFFERFKKREVSFDLRRHESHLLEEELEAEVKQPERALTESEQKWSPIEETKKLFKNTMDLVGVSFAKKEELVVDQKEKTKSRTETERQRSYLASIKGLFQSTLASVGGG
ncbi:MAG: hypothetical protein SNF33_02045 [Candidatus Algichlamydia australiensis]|nr:hypothetical protein [Chlamydiales bacterium]